MPPGVDNKKESVFSRAISKLTNSQDSKDNFDTVTLAQASSNPSKKELDEQKAAAKWRVEGKRSESGVHTGKFNKERDI